MPDITETLNERKSTHGDYSEHAQITQDLKKVIQSTSLYGSRAMSDTQRETLDMICHKIGRILAGNPNFFDHWHDIAGYATLSANLCKEENVTRN